MSGAGAADARSWAEPAAARTWPGVRAARIAALKGDASSRRFWRIHLDPRPDDAPASAIVVDLGPEDLPAYVRALGLIPNPPPEPLYLNMQRFLKSIGCAVPEIYEFSAADRLMLVEDVGETALFDAALAGTEKPSTLYRLAVDELLLIHVEGTRLLSDACVAAHLSYDARLFRYELEQFVSDGIGSLGVAAPPAGLETELDELARRLGNFPRVLSHRDYHGNNLWLQHGRIRVIDFQDALMAPAAQDLAVLLTTRDTGRVISTATESRLLDYYLAGLARRGAAALAQDEMLESYRLCVLQHSLKIIGRFNALERQGKPGYAGYIPYAIAEARRMLMQTDEFPTLRDLFQANLESTDSA